MSLHLCHRFHFDTEGTALSAFDVSSHSLSCHRLHFDAAGGLGRVCGTFAPPCFNMDPRCGNTTNHWLTREDGTLSVVRM